MRRAEITTEYATDDPKGMGVAALLTSDVYGLRSELDLETLHLLDEKRGLATKNPLTDQELSRLRELDEHLRGLDFTTTVRDPLYKPFVDAMSARERAEGLQTPVLTKEQQNKQKDLARQILAELAAAPETGE